MLMLILGSALQAQSFSFRCFVGSNDYEANYGFWLVTPDDMYDAFKQDVLEYNESNDNNITLPTKPYPLIEMVSTNDWTKPENVAAYTWACDTTPEVKINSGWWNNTETTFELKMLVMYHEFGHAILNLQHNCNEGDIMVSPGLAAEDPNCNGTNPGTDLASFLTAKNNMIAGINQIAYNCYGGKGNKEIID